MKQSPADLVREFHIAFGLPSRTEPCLIRFEEIDLRQRLITEEIRETYQAMNSWDLIEIADGLADSVYVLYGTALHYGIPLDDILQEVHKSNMSKLPKNGKILFRSDGKILKPDTWVKPDIDRIIQEAIE